MPRRRLRARLTAGWVWLSFSAVRDAAFGDQQAEDAQQVGVERVVAASGRHGGRGGVYRKVYRPYKPSSIS
jgi:hypothetical protein